MRTGSAASSLDLAVWFNDALNAQLSSPGVSPGCSLRMVAAASDTSGRVSGVWVGGKYSRVGAGTGFGVTSSWMHTRSPALYTLFVTFCFARYWFLKRRWNMYMAVRVSSLALGMDVKSAAVCESRSAVCGAAVELASDTSSSSSSGRLGDIEKVSGSVAGCHLPVSYADSLISVYGGALRLMISLMLFTRFRTSSGSFASVPSVAAVRAVRVSAARCPSVI